MKASPAAQMLCNGEIAYRTSWKKILLCSFPIIFFMLWFAAMMFMDKKAYIYELIYEN